MRLIWGRWDRLEPGLYAISRSERYADLDSDDQSSASKMKAREARAWDLERDASEQIETYLRERAEEATHTKPMDVTPLMAPIERLYGLLGLAVPPIIVASSPFVAAVAAALAAAAISWEKHGNLVDFRIVLSEFLNDEIKSAVNQKISRGAWEASTIPWLMRLWDRIPRDFGILTSESMFWMIQTDYPRDLNRAERDIVEILGQALGKNFNKAWQTLNSAEKNVGLLRLAEITGQNIASNLFSAGKANFIAECIEPSLCTMKPTTTRDPDEQDCFWIAQKFLGAELTPSWQDWLALSNGCTSFWLHERFCIVSDFPEVCRLDDRSRLHCDDGPAIKWRDGLSLYYLEGLSVTQQIVEAPETLTAERIAAERDIEIRRLMMSRFGEERFLAESKAKIIHKDKYGVLYQQRLSGDEPLTMVKVKNSTPEPDGSERYYFLRVPPNIDTAREAVAWTFGLDPEEYSPEFES